MKMGKSRIKEEKVLYDWLQSPEVYCSELYQNLFPYFYC